MRHHRLSLPLGKHADWKPIYNLCEGLFTVLVVNAQHTKAVPGCKTDVKDAEWIAELLRERTREVNRLQKVLKGVNIKLASVASDVLGVSGRAILEAIVRGTTRPAALASLARGRLCDKRAELQRALSGRVRAHQRFLLAERLCHLAALEESTTRVSAEQRLRPLEEEIARLETIPGVGRRVAEVLLAEIGADMGRFPSAGHLASWSGMCPGSDESAGKRKSGTTSKGSPWLRAALAEAAWSASRTKDTYLCAQYHRLAARRGRKRAVVPVGHSILVTAYYVLKRRQTYADLGGNYFDERECQSVQLRLMRLLQKPGLKVTLEPISQAA